MVLPIRAVSLDAMNTIIKLREPIGVTYMAFAELVIGGNRIKTTADRINAAFPVQFAKLSRESPCYGHGRDGGAFAWWLTLVRRCFVDSQMGDDQLLDDVGRRLFDHYSTARAWNVDDDIGDQLRRLRRNGVRIAIASNFDSRLRNILAEMHLLPLIDVIILSGELGVAKPDAALFRALLDQLQLDDARQVLHVGDDYDNDYCAAKSVGMRALLLDPHNTYPAVDRIVALADICVK